MNLICNCCTGGWYYKIKKKQFSNPFIWSGISSNSMVSLINHYDEIIKTNDINIEKEYQNNEITFTILLPYNIKVHFHHYILDLSLKENVKKGPDVYGPRIYEYTYNKFIERRARINEKPIFLIITRTDDLYDYTLEKCQKYINEYKGNYEIIFITNYKELKTNNEKIKIILENEDVNKLHTSVYIERYFN